MLPSSNPILNNVRSGIAHFRLQYNKRPTEIWMTKDDVRVLIVAYGLPDILKEHTLWGMKVHIHEGPFMMICRERQGDGNTWVIKWSEDRFSEAIVSPDQRAATWP